MDNTEGEVNEHQISSRLSHSASMDAATQGIIQNSSNALLTKITACLIGETSGKLHNQLMELNIKRADTLAKGKKMRKYGCGAWDSKPRDQLSFQMTRQLIRQAEMQLFWKDENEQKISKLIIIHLICRNLANVSEYCNLTTMNWADTFSGSSTNLQLRGATSSISSIDSRVWDPKEECHQQPLVEKGGIAVPSQVAGGAPAVAVAPISSSALGQGPSTLPDVHLHRQGRANVGAPGQVPALPLPPRQTPIPVIGTAPVPARAPPPPVRSLTTALVGPADRANGHGRLENQLRVTFQLDARDPVMAAAPVSARIPVAALPPILLHRQSEPALVGISDRVKRGNRKSSQPPVPRSPPSSAITSSRGRRSPSSARRSFSRGPRQPSRASRSRSRDQHPPSESRREPSQAPRSSSRGQRQPSRAPRSRSRDQQSSSQSRRVSSQAPRSSSRGQRQPSRAPRSRSRDQQSSSQSRRVSSQAPRSSSRGQRQPSRAPRSRSRDQQSSSQSRRVSSQAPRSSSRGPKQPARAPRSRSRVQQPPSQSRGVSQAPRSSSRAQRSSSRAPGSLGSCPTTIDGFMESLRNTRGGSFKTAPEQFTRKFAQGEHLLDNRDVTVKTWKNGVDFMRNVRDFNEIHLIKNKRGLGMMVPENLDFDTIQQHINTTQRYSIINSRTQRSEEMTIRELLAEFKKSQRPKIWNMLSMEFDRENQKLRQKFNVPEFVRQNSIIKKLKRALEEQLNGIKEELKNAPNGPEKDQLKTEKTRLNHQLSNMPKYQKFLLLSMAESFTDVHVDFSATSVYYHVKKRKKIFYVAKPTPENLRIYKDFEMGRNTERKWIGEVLSKEWRRIEIGEGETAMIPSGYIHFVYTPEDSIVIGGNYLMEKYLKQQFELTKLEERCVGRTITYSNMMEGFWNVMWSYVENCVVPSLRESPETRDLMNLARICSGELDPEQIHPDDWYTVQEKKKILEHLKELELAQPQGTSRKRRSQGATGPASKKTK